MSLRICTDSNEHSLFANGVNRALVHKLYTVCIYVFYLSRCSARLAPVLKAIFINMSYQILVACLTLMALKTEPSELD